MKLRKAKIIAHHNGYSHVAVDKFGSINMFLDEPSIIEDENGNKLEWFDDISERGEKIHIGMYTGKKKWRKTLTKVEFKNNEQNEEDQKVNEIKAEILKAVDKYDGDPLIVYAAFDAIKEIFVDEEAEELRPAHQFINEVYMESMSGLFD